VAARVAAAAAGALASTGSPHGSTTRRTGRRRRPRATRSGRGGAREGRCARRRPRAAVELAEAYRDYSAAPAGDHGGRAAFRDRRLAEQASQLGADDDGPPARLARFATQRHRDWLAAHEKRQQYRRRWAAFFREHDVAPRPASPVTAIHHDHEGDVFTRTCR
jgi:hypothetical protein